MKLIISSNSSNQNRKDAVNQPTNTGIILSVENICKSLHNTHSHTHTSDCHLLIALKTIISMIIYMCVCVCDFILTFN